MPGEPARPTQVLHLLIHGQVQGVGYRWSMVDEAGRLGVRGWVRNRRDGTVEAMVVGTVADVDALVAWARRGPRGARVTKVEASASGADFDGFDAFVQLPTA